MSAGPPRAAVLTARGRGAVAVIAVKSFVSRTSRSALRASSWVVTLRTRALNTGPPAPSHVVTNRRTMFSPSRSGPSAVTSSTTARTSNGMWRTAWANSPSLPPNQWFTIAGSTPALVAMALTVARW